jgi:SAM-dependent methyltransferase
MSGDGDDVPSPIDFHDEAQARAWLADTVARRPYRPTYFAAFARALNAIGRPGLRVLEIGSGPGHLARHVLDHCAIGAYTALDFSAAMHALAREHLGPLAGQVIIVQADFREPGWSAGLSGFDAVITMQALHETRHKRHLPGVLRAAAGMLRPGGTFLYCDHYFEPGGGKAQALYLTRDEQPQALAANGFTAVTKLHDEAGMALYGAVKA